MASISLPCAPCRVSFGGTAVSAQKGKTAPSAVAMVAKVGRSGSGRFEGIFVSGADGQRSGVATAGGGPVAALRPLSRSASFGGSATAPWYLGSDVVRPSNSSRTLAVHDVTAHAMEKIPDNAEMLEAYEIEEKVRDYELDHYGVVNNAIYDQFCQHARYGLLANVGFTADAVIESGNYMAVSELSMKFVSPLRSGDEYIVSSRVSGISADSINFEDKIYKLPRRELIMSANATVVVVDKEHRPTRIPDELKVKLLSLKIRNNSPSTGDADVKSTNRHGDSASTEANSNSTTNGQKNGTSTTNGQENGNSTTNGGQENGNSTTNGQENGKSTKGQLNGTSTNGQVNGNLRTGLNVDCYSTNGQVISNSSSGYDNHGNSARVNISVAS